MKTTYFEIIMKLKFSDKQQTMYVYKISPLSYDMSSAKPFRFSRQGKPWHGAKIRFWDFDGFTRFEVH